MIITHNFYSEDNQRPPPLILLRAIKCAAIGDPRKGALPPLTPGNLVWWKSNFKRDVAYTRGLTSFLIIEKEIAASFITKKLGMGRQLTMREFHTSHSHDEVLNAEPTMSDHPAFKIAAGEDLQIKKKRQVKRLRDHELKIRFTENELSQIKQKAGNKRAAQYMREFCLAAPDAPSPSVKLPQIDPMVLRQLMGACNNLNQIARYINTLNLANQPVDHVMLLLQLTKISELLQQIESNCSIKRGHDAG